MEAATRFGAKWGAPAETVRVLRARAARFGCELGPLSDVDAAAAVLGAEGWLVTTGAAGFERPAGQGPGAVAALAAVLRRCAGGAGCGAAETVSADADDLHLAEVARWVRWLGAYGLDVREVLERVAYDLAVGASDRRLASIAAAAAVTADTLTLNTWAS